MPTAICGLDLGSSNPTRKRILRYLSHALRASRHDMELSIRALHSDLASEQSLPQLIARIHEQRGHFRNVTEASLEEEIRAAEASGQGQVDQPAVQTDQPDVRDDEVRRTHLYEARAEMIKLVRWRVLCPAMLPRHR